MASSDCKTFNKENINFSLKLQPPHPTRPSSLAGVGQLPPPAQPASSQYPGAQGCLPPAVSCQGLVGKRFSSPIHLHLVTPVHPQTSAGSVTPSRTTFLSWGCLALLPLLGQSGGAAGEATVGEACCPIRVLVRSRLLHFQPSCLTVHLGKHCDAPGSSCTRHRNGWTQLRAPSFNLAGPLGSL